MVVAVMWGETKSSKNHRGTSIVTVLSPFARKNSYMVGNSTDDDNRQDVHNIGSRHNADQERSEQDCKNKNEGPKPF